MKRPMPSIRQHARPRGRAEQERGQIIVLFTLVIVAILAFTALVVDVGLLRNNRQSLANAVDAGALAGGTLMPVDGSQSGAAAAVVALINQTIRATYPGLSTSNYNITYRCLVGTGAGNAGAFDKADIDAFVPVDCDPRNALGHNPPVLGDFTGAGKTRSSACRPDLGDKCNVVMVAGNVTTPYSFARVVGVNSGNTGVVQSAACRGYCGELPDVPFDVVLVIDNSGSMSTVDAGHSRLYWAQKASNQLMDELTTSTGVQQVGAVRYSGTWNSTRAPLPAETLSTLTTNFTTVRNKIGALTAAGNTPLKQGMAMGRTVLAAGARPGVQHVLVFLSDGRPNPDTTSTARPTSAEVAAFRAGADQVYSIAIGAGGTGANNPDLPLMRSLAKPDPADHFFHVVDFERPAGRLPADRGGPAQAQVAPHLGVSRADRDRRRWQSHGVDQWQVLHGHDAGHVRWDQRHIQGQQRHIDHRDGAERSVRSDRARARHDAGWIVPGGVRGPIPVPVS